MTTRQIHITKTFTWRVVASLTTFTIAWAATGDLDLGLKVGAIDVVAKLILYYLHERVWYTGAEKKQVLLEEAKKTM